MKKIYSNITLIALVTFTSCSSNPKQTVTPSIDSIENTTALLDRKPAVVDSIANNLPKDSLISQHQSVQKIVSTVKKLEKEHQLSLPTPPNFADEDVNKGVHKFANDIRENIIAKQNKDSAKLKVLKEELSGMPMKMTFWILKMSSDEREVFKTYLQQVTKIAKQAEKQ